MTRHAVDATVRETKNNSAPVKTAPRMLVATKRIANNTTESNAVPKIPIRMLFIVLPMQPFPIPSCENRAPIKSTAKYPIATPSVTHRKAGVTVIIPINRKNAAITPMIKLATTAVLVHVFLCVSPVSDTQDIYNKKLTEDILS